MARYWGAASTAVLMLWAAPSGGQAAANAVASAETEAQRGPARRTSGERDDADTVIVTGERLAELAPPIAGVGILGDTDVLDTPVPGLTLIGGVSHSGRAPFDMRNSFDVPGYTKWEGGARYAFRAGDTDLSARLSIDNLIQARYWNAGDDGGIFPAVPRTVALALGAEF